MKRTNYRNGDEIGLACGCDGCSPSRINGVLCHERGCPDAWRDVPKECFECGCDVFVRGPADWRPTCEDCANPPAEECFVCDECGDEYFADDYHASTVDALGCGYLCPRCFRMDQIDAYEDFLACDVGDGDF